MGLLGFTLIPYEWGPYKKGKFGQTGTQGERHGRDHGGHVQGKECQRSQQLLEADRGRKVQSRSPLQPSGGTHPANALVLAASLYTVRQYVSAPHISAVRADPSE